VRKKIFFKLSIITGIALIFVYCSSAPKDRGDVYILRTHAENLLETANREAGRGNYNNALVILDESKRNAILSDDPSAIIRSSLSRANVLYSLGRTDEAFSEWQQSISEAQKSGNTELLSVCRIFYARGCLLSGRTSAQNVLDEVNREQVNIKTDRLYIAFSWQVKGLALRALGLYADAENAIRNSLDIHEKERYLENASYDWYTIASIRSLAGNTSGALQALETAIAIDRRIENSWGLAASWRAVGDVYRREGNEREALEAYNRARVMYDAMRNDIEVREINNRIESLKTGATNE
jgi:tetratricopeptide (TPR) repeat protein